MASRVCASLYAAVLLSAVARPAAAEDAPPKEDKAKDDKAKARQSYTEGETAYRLGRFHDAAAKYETAYELTKFPTILFDIGQAYRKWYEADKNADHLRKSLEMYRAFLRDAPAARQSEVAERLIPDIVKTLAEENLRRRQELITRAAGRDGLFLADQLMRENALADAALVIERVLAGRQNPRDVVVSALEKRGLCAGALGKKDVALESFRRALTLDPGFAVPEGSDKTTQDAFLEAKASLTGTKPLGITHIPPGDVKKGQPASFAIHVESDPLGLIDELAVFHRRAGGGAYSRVRAKTATPNLEVPAAFLSGLPGGSRIEYYVVALDALEGELALQGSAKEPFVFAIAADPSEHKLAEAPAPVAAPPPPFWYRRWYVWTAAAAVVVGGGVAGVIIGTWPFNPPLVVISTRP